MKVKIYIGGFSISRYEQSSRGIWARYTSHHMMMADGIVIDSTSYSLDCTRTIAIVRDFATKNGLKVKIYDVAKDLPAFRAWLDRIKKIPTTVIGKQKIEGVPTLEELNNTLAMINK